MSDEELKQAMAELQEVVRCRCDEAYRDRGLKDPHCECDSAEAVKIVADHIKALTVESARRLALARSEGVARVEQFERTEALTEQLAAARQDAKEAEAYAEELEKELDTCRMAQAVMDNTVADFEAKLAKAADMMLSLIAMIQHAIGPGKDVYIEPDTGRKLSDARATLAEIKGGSQDGQ